MKKSVFVIGAGASSEVNLPTGKDLKTSISELLDIRYDSPSLVSGDYCIAQALGLQVKEDGEGDGTINSYINEACHIRDALPQAISIDNFIDAHRDNSKIALCGKLAIVKSILMAENNSSLFIDNPHRNSLDFAKLADTWYSSFFQLLTENCILENLKDRLSSVSLIIFNYDRCIEHFLLHAFKNYYRVSDTVAAHLVSSLSMYHPYGSVGSLQWQGLENFIGFGEEPSAQKLLDLTRKIKTFAEGTDPESSQISQIKEHMNKANKLVFLGFAFHKLNMQLLELDPLQKMVSHAPKCFATTFGISANDQVIVKEQIRNLYAKVFDSQMINKSCHDFFSEFWKSLAI